MDSIVLGVQRVGYDWATFTLSFIHQMPMASPPKVVTKNSVSKYWHLSPGVKTLVENHFLRTTSIHHPNPCYLCDLISYSLSPLSPPCYTSLLDIPWSCQNSFCIRSFLSVISHVITVCSATWSVHDQPLYQCMIRHMISAWSVTWSVYNHPRDQCMHSQVVSVLQPCDQCMISQVNSAW